jgi:anaerobic magnesium-protoporphyrin IX monomethyl ester cyclase
MTDMALSILFVEPPKDYWFLMGEYLPPPTSLLTLAAYIERELPDVEVEVMDCQAEAKGWKDIENRISSISPSIVAASGFTCNAYVCARVAEIAKQVSEDIVTVMGGQHFSFTAEESLLDFPEIDFIVRGEGEITLVELIRCLAEGSDPGRIHGLSFWHDGVPIHNPLRELIPNLDSLPFPAYHLVEDNLHRYHFSMMAGKNTRYLILEGSRGCSHHCSFCTQWRHWGGTWRTKSPRRIADEMEHLHQQFDGEFLWLTDDNFDYRRRGEGLWEELRKRDLKEDFSWFFQARTDDIVRNPELVSKLREVGNTWILVGVESDSPDRLDDFNKSIGVKDAFQAMRVLRENDVFAQAMVVIGSRGDTEKSIERTREFSHDLKGDLLIYSVLTPLPGTEVHATASKNGWIEDANYAHYDMVHAIMPTETLTRREVQEELFRCYRSFYGSVPKNISGFFSKNDIKRRCYRHMAGKRVLSSLRRLI